MVLFDADAVDDLVSASGDGEKVHPISEDVVKFSHVSDVENSRWKAVYIQVCDHEDIQIMEVYVQLDQTGEVLHRLRFTNETHKGKLQ